MILTNEKLQAMIDDQIEYVGYLQSEPDDIIDELGGEDEFENHLTGEQAVVAALVELAAWRSTHPDERMEEVFMSSYGPTGLQ